MQKNLHMNRNLLTRLLTLSIAILLILNLTQCTSYQPAPSAERSVGYAPATPPMPPASSVRTKVVERPGLGTGLGRKLQDASEATTFYTKVQGVPDAVASFHYNDEEGAKLMAEQLGRVGKRSGSFEIVPNRLRVSLTSGWRGSGGAFPRYEAGGKAFVIGQPGQTYAIRLENVSKEALMAVVSVDGLDVLTGKQASVKAPGYVIGAGKVAIIEGIKVDSVLRAFEFSKVSQSQAAVAYGEKGAENVGVIGIAIYEEDAAARKRALLREGAVREGAQAFATGSP